MLSWNLLSHLFLKCKYGRGPAFPVRMITAEGGWYGSHFPSRCSSYFPQTQQRHEISLTSDSEKVDNHFFVWASSLGKAAAHYLIMSKIIPIRPWYEYWNISLICEQGRSLNMPIVFTVSITYFKWHGKIIYVNMTSAEAEWCLAKQKRLSDLLGLWFQGKRCQEIWGKGWWLQKEREALINGRPCINEIWTPSSDTQLTPSCRAHPLLYFGTCKRMKDLPKGPPQQEGRIWKKREKAGWVPLQDLWIKIERGREMPSNLKVFLK